MALQQLLDALREQARERRDVERARADARVEEIRARSRGDLQRRRADFIGQAREEERASAQRAIATAQSEATRSILRWLGIEPHIRHQQGDHGSHLGRVRWVVERTISWIKGLRRMRVRYDRSRTSIDAWTSLAAAVVCLHVLTEAVT